MNELNYEEVLQKCKEGFFTKDLKKLYDVTIRESVPWNLFPSWARPNAVVEGAHEGGAI